MTTNTTTEVETAERVDCPSCQGAGYVAGSSGRSGLGPSSFPCRTCWRSGRVSPEFRDSHPDHAYAEAARAEGRDPRFTDSGAPFFQPRAFRGFVASRSAEVVGGWFVRPDRYGKFESGRHGEVYGDDHSWADAFAGFAQEIEAEGDCPRCAIEHGAIVSLTTDLDDRPLCIECGWQSGEEIATP